MLDWINGFIVEPQNSNDLVSKIELFLEMSYVEKKEMGLAGRIKVKNEFNRNIVVGAYWKEISKI